MPRSTSILLLLIASLCLVSVCLPQNKRGPRTRDYERFLDKLQTDAAPSIVAAVDSFRRVSPLLSQIQKDSAFRAFYLFYYKVLNNLSEKLMEDSLTNYRLESALVHSEPEYSAEVGRLADSLNRRGVGLFASDGVFYCDQPTRFLYDSLSAHVSGPAREFLFLRSIELGQGFSEGSMLLVGFDTLARWVIGWDIFMSRYPEFVLNDVAQFYFESYLEGLLHGLRNTKIVDENGKLFDNVLRAQQTILRELPGSRSGDIVAGYQEILRRTGFRYTKEIEEFLERNELNHHHTPTR